MKRNMLAFIASLSILSCQKDVQPETVLAQSSNKTASTVQATVPYDSNNPILKNANTDVLVGAAINSNEFYNDAYLNRAKTQYNSITAENEMKFHFIQAEQGKFVFADKTVQFIKDNLGNNARLHGHALIWYKKVPDWVWNAGGTTTGETRKQIYRVILYKHIDSVFKHYYKIKDVNGKPLVKSWDVVNEVFKWNSGEYRDIDRGNQDASVWAKELGDYDHVRLAFKYAREIALKIGDYDLKLFYNDYGHEEFKSKCDAIYNLVTDLKNEPPLTANVNGVTKSFPIIDGVGMQMHTNHLVPISEGGTESSIEYSIKKMKTTGLLVHISELDIQVKNATTTPTTAQRDAQAARWKAIPIIYRTNVPDGQRWGITLWNIGDTDSWRTRETGTYTEATLYEKGTYYRKPTYEAFYRGLYELGTY